MTNMQLLEAIGMLDDETILDAEQEPVRRATILPTPRVKRLTRQITALAACACLLFGGALLAQVGGWSNSAEDSMPGVNGAGTFAPEGVTPTGAPSYDAPIGEATVAATTAGMVTEDPSTPQYTTTGVHATTTTFVTPEAEGSMTAAVSTTAAPSTTRPPYTTTTAAATTVPMTTTTAGTHLVPEIIVPESSLMVYAEDFNSYADTALSLDTLDLLGWTKLTVAGDKAYSESDVAFAICDGRLYFDNHDTTADTFGDGTLTRGKDAYYAIDLLDDEYMHPVVTGKYTMQYDIEYVGAADVRRYAALITEFSADRQCYNSFHLRIGGLANHQCHFYGSWKTFSSEDPAIDLNPSADDPTGAKGTPLLTKLLGLHYAEYADQMNLAGRGVTVRLQWDPEMGHHVYLKTADMTEFVKVSAPIPRDKVQEGDAPMFIGWRGWAVGLKIGGAVEGYLDNIRIWTGWGDAPTDEWYQPSAY